jgi:two-component system, response regulator
MEQQIILLVEDNPDDVELTRRALLKNDAHFQMTVAADGEAALNLLFGSEDGDSFLPSFLLLDLNLPKIDGLEVLRRIRVHPRTRALPVIIMTGSREEEAFLESCSLGVDAYVRKPVDVRQIDAALRQLRLSSLLAG